MKRRITVISMLVVIIALSASLTQAQAPIPQLVDAVPAAFTYQGYLADTGNQPVSGTCEFRLRLYDAASSGNQVGSVITTTTVISGYFALPVDFGASAFSGAARWIETGVKCPGDADYTALPRQALGAVPYATHASSSSALQGYPVDSSAPSAGQVLKWNGSMWAPGGDDVSVVVSGTNVYAGDGLYSISSDNNITMNVSFAGTGSAIAAARSDHDHDSRYSLLGHVHPGSDITSPVTQAVNATYATTAISATTASYATTASSATTSDYAADADLLDGQHGTYYQVRVGGACDAGSAIRVIGTDGSVTCENTTTAITATYATTATWAANADMVDDQHASAFATVAHTHAGGDITSGTVADARIASTIARDSEITPTVWAHDGAGSGLDADLLDGLQASAFASSNHTHDHGSLTGLLDDDHPQYVGISIARTITVRHTFNPNATGSPFILGANAINQLVAGFNADLLDGNHSSAFAAASHNHDSSYWKLTGNTGTAPGTNFLGTTDNQALEFKVNGARALRLVPDSTSPSIIEGYSGNYVTMGVRGATIGGGGLASLANSVTDHYGTVGGGSANQAGDSDADVTSAIYAFVGSGYGNSASASYAVIGGGQSNSILQGGGFIGGGSGNAVSGTYGAVCGGSSNTANTSSFVGGGNANTVLSAYSVIAGGANNFVNGSDGVIGGGTSNIVNANYATVPGGMSNSASGTYSFAAGQRAHANHTGAFVWGDSSTADVASTGNNQFIVRAQQIWFGTTSAPSWPANAYLATSTGAYLTTGGTWTNSSDQNAKDNFAPVNGRELLDRLAQVPVTTWNYKAEGSSIRHIGPMAQDFYAAFNIGQDDKHISTVDADGVALASAQALYQIVQEQGQQISNLKAQNADLEARLARLEQRANGGTSSLLNGWSLLGLGLVVAAGVVATRRGKMP